MAELAKNHVTLTSTQEMRDISKPLKPLGIDFFSYTRFYFDGTTISLLTHTKWYEHFLQREIPGCVNVFNMKTGCNLWEEAFPEEANAEARNLFDIDNGINFTYRNEKYVEIISYASNAGSKKNIGYFISILDLLEKFIPYFREHADTLVKESAKHKITIPKIMRGYNEVHSKLMLNPETRKLFLEQICYDNNKVMQLSRREYQCLKLIAQGKTFKESAKTLNISHRTVESHVDHIKTKLNCDSKSELVNIYWKISGNNSDMLDPLFTEETR